MTRIYAAVSNKGGAGKTTLVTLAAGEYAVRDERVLIIDADPRQNLSGWWRLCHNKENVPDNIDVTTAATSRTLETAIDRMSAAFDLIIIDAPGVDTSLQTAIVRSADLVISPVQPAIKEIEAAGQAAALVNQINDDVGSVIQHLNVRTRVTIPARNMEAYRYIRPFIAGLQEAQYQTALVDTELFERNIYREIQNGLGTLQMQELSETVRKARAEVQGLITEIEKRHASHKQEKAA